MSPADVAASLANAKAAIAAGVARDAVINKLKAGGIADDALQGL